MVAKSTSVPPMRLIASNGYTIRILGPVLRGIPVFYEYAAVIEDACGKWQSTIALTYGPTEGASLRRCQAILPACLERYELEIQNQKRPPSWNNARERRILETMRLVKGSNPMMPESQIREVAETSEKLRQQQRKDEQSAARLALRLSKRKSGKQKSGK